MSRVLDRFLDISGKYEQTRRFGAGMHWITKGAEGVMENKKLSYQLNDSWHEGAFLRKRTVTVDNTGRSRSASIVEALSSSLHSTPMSI